MGKLISVAAAAFVTGRRATPTGTVGSRRIRCCVCCVERISTPCRQELGSSL